jgi:hypothetical protein
MGPQGEQLEREAQQARAQLSGPLEELRARMAPGATDRSPLASTKEVSQQNPWQDVRVMEQAHEPH